MSNVSKRKREGSRAKIKSMGDHKEFLRRITKTLYYGELPTLPCLSLPLTEISCEEWSSAQRGRSLRRLHVDAAARAARRARVAPAALVLALLYLERLRAHRPDYLAQVSPTDLFLVSLMVGNKFLQDDGEDDEVVCSEWAASGGLDLAHLKKIEIQFLNAMDWNVYVSEKHFESGLQWLERRVALKQAGQRGWFTYTDLCSSGDPAHLAAGLRDLTTATALAAAAYLASLLALLSSALIVVNLGLPSLHQLAPTADLTPAQTLDVTTPMHIQVPYVSNATLNMMNMENHINERVDCCLPNVDEQIRCCPQWLKRKETPKRWFDSMVVYDWKNFEQWWSRTSLHNWLYQSSIVNPVLRWLEKINEYADVVKEHLDMEKRNKCEEYDEVKDVNDRKCAQWLNLSKLSALLVTVSDR